MPEANDMDLVREFARTNSEAAFTELVRRHINLVYSVARRCTDTDGDAQDVTQAVFIVLARKATRMRENTLLGGWLYETTRLTASQMRRTNARRHAREREAYMQSTLNEANTTAVWEKLSPHLEAAMSKLAERDRALLVLRFYENKSGPEAAALLGIREDAAHKRLARAIEKLRKIFAQRGVALTATAIAGAVSANSVQAAPVAMAKSITAVAMTKGVAASGSALTLTKGALKIMAWTKAKTTIVAGAGLLLAAVTTTSVVIHENRAPNDMALRKIIIGVWHMDIASTNGMGGRSILTYDTNGTFTCQRTYTDSTHTNWSFGGRYEVKDGFLIETVTTTTPPGVMQSKIIHANGNEMVVSKDGQAHIIQKDAR